MGNTLNHDIKKPIECESNNDFVIIDRDLLSAIQEETINDTENTNEIYINDNIYNRLKNNDKLDMTMTSIHEDEDSHSNDDIDDSEYAQYILPTNKNAKNVNEWIAHFAEHIKDLYIEDLIDNKTMYNVNNLFEKYVEYRNPHHASYVTFTERLRKVCKSNRKNK